MILHLPVLSYAFLDSYLSYSTLHFLLHLNTQHILYSSLPSLFPALRFQNRSETYLLWDRPLSPSILS